MALDPSIWGDIETPTSSTQSSGLYNSPGIEQAGSSPRGMNPYSDLSNNPQSLPPMSPTEAIYASKLQQLSDDAVPGKKGMSDAVSDLIRSPYVMLPYVNAIEVFDTGAHLMLSRKATRGEASQEELSKLQAMNMDLQREKSMGYNVVNMSARLLAFAIEVATIGGIVKGVVKGTLMASSKAAIRQASKEFGKKLASPTARGGIAAASRMSFNAGQKIAKKIGPLPENSKWHKALEFYAEDTSLNLTRYTKDFLPKAFAGLKAAKKTRPAAEKTAISMRKGMRDAKRGGRPRRPQPAGTSDDAIKAMQEEIKWKQLRLTGRALGSAAAQAPIYTLLSPHRILNEHLSRRTPHLGFSEDDDGQLEAVLLEDGEGFWEAFAKSVADTGIEMFSERVGEVFFGLGALMGGKLGTASLKKGAMDALAAKRVRLANAAGAAGDTVGFGAKKMGELKKVMHEYFGPKSGPGRLREHFVGQHGGLGDLGRRLGWNGVFNELLEEQVGLWIRVPLGIQDAPESAGEWLEQVVTEGIAFALNPLSIGKFTSDEYFKAVDKELKVQREFLSNIKTDEKDLLTRIRTDKEMEGAVDGLERYITMVLSKPETMLGKVLKGTVGRGRQSAIEQLYEQQLEINIQGFISSRLSDSEGLKEAAEKAELTEGYLTPGEFEAILESEEGSLQFREDAKRFLAQMGGFAIAKDEAERIALLGTPGDPKEIVLAQKRKGARSALTDEGTVQFFVDEADFINHRELKTFQKRNPHNVSTTMDIGAEGRISKDGNVQLTPRDIAGITADIPRQFFEDNGEWDDMDKKGKLAWISIIGAYDQAARPDIREAAAVYKMLHGIITKSDKKRILFGDNIYYLGTKNQFKQVHQPVPKGAQSFDDKGTYAQRLGALSFDDAQTLFIPKTTLRKLRRMHSVAEDITESAIKDLIKSDLNGDNLGLIKDFVGSMLKRSKVLKKEIEEGDDSNKAENLQLVEDLDRLIAFATGGTGGEMTQPGMIEVFAKFFKRDMLGFGLADELVDSFVERLAKDDVFRLEERWKIIEDRKIFNGTGWEGALEAIKTTTRSFVDAEKAREDLNKLDDFDDEGLTEEEKKKIEEEKKRKALEEKRKKDAAEKAKRDADRKKSKETDPLGPDGDIIIIDEPDNPYDPDENPIDDGYEEGDEGWTEIEVTSSTVVEKAEADRKEQNTVVEGAAETKDQLDLSQADQKPFDDPSLDSDRGGEGPEEGFASLPPEDLISSGNNDDGYLLGTSAQAIMKMLNQFGHLNDSTQTLSQSVGFIAAPVARISAELAAETNYRARLEIRKQFDNFPVRDIGYEMFYMKTHPVDREKRKLENPEYIKNLARLHNLMTMSDENFLKEKNVVNSLIKSKRYEEAVDEESVISLRHKMGWFIGGNQRRLYEGNMRVFVKEPQFYVQMEQRDPKAKKPDSWSNQETKIIRRIPNSSKNAAIRSSLIGDPRTGRPSEYVYMGVDHKSKAAGRTKTYITDRLIEHGYVYGALDGYTLRDRAGKVSRYPGDETTFGTNNQDAEDQGEYGVLSRLFWGESFDKHGRKVVSEAMNRDPEADENEYESKKEWYVPLRKAGDKKFIVAVKMKRWGYEELVEELQDENGWYNQQVEASRKNMGGTPIELEPASSLLSRLTQAEGNKDRDHHVLYVNQVFADTQLVKDIWGGYDSFKDVQDMNKRLSQSGTPAIGFNAEYLDKDGKTHRRKIRVVVFDDIEDLDLMDGASFFGNDSLSRWFIQTFGYNMWSAGNLGGNVEPWQIKAHLLPTLDDRFVNIKPMFHNIDALINEIEESDSPQLAYYHGIKKIKDQLEEKFRQPVIMMPSSSVKSKLVKNEISAESLWEQHEDKTQMPIGVKDVDISEIEGVEVDAGDFYILGNFNQSAEAQLKKSLVQIKGTRLLHAEGGQGQRDRVAAIIRLENDLHEILDEEKFKVFGENSDQELDNLAKLIKFHLANLTPEEASKFSNTVMFGRLQELFEYGQSVLRMGDTELAMNLMHGYMRRVSVRLWSNHIGARMQQKANRLMRTTIPQGAEKSSDYLHPDKDGKLIAGKFYGNLYRAVEELDDEGNPTGVRRIQYFYSSENAKSEFSVHPEAKTRANFIRWLENSADRSKYWWMYDTNMEGLNTNGRVREEFIREEIDENGALYFTIPGTLVIKQRIPASSTGFESLLFVEGTVGQTRNPVSMISREEAGIMGEDYDADQSLIDVMEFDRDGSVRFNRRKSRGIQNRVLAVRMSLILNMDADMLKRQRAPLNTEDFIKNVSADPSEAPETERWANSPSGQKYAAIIMSNQDDAIGIGASSSRIVRYLNYLRIPWVEGRSTLAITLPNGEIMNLKRDSETVSGYTRKNIELLDHYFGNLLIQKIVDDTKHGSLHRDGISKDTVALVYAIAMGRIHEYNTEDDVIKDLKAIFNLFNSPLYTKYIALMAKTRQPSSMIKPWTQKISRSVKSADGEKEYSAIDTVEGVFDILTNEAIESKGLRWTEADVEVIKKLGQISTEMKNARDLFDAESTRSSDEYTNFRRNVLIESAHMTGSVLTDKSEIGEKNWFDMFYLFTPNPDDARDLPIPVDVFKNAYENIAFDAKSIHRGVSVLDSPLGMRIYRDSKPPYYNEEGEFIEKKNPSLPGATIYGAYHNTLQLAIHLHAAGLSNFVRSEEIGGYNIAEDIATSGGETSRSNAILNRIGERLHKKWKAAEEAADEGKIPDGHLFWSKIFISKSVTSETDENGKTTNTPRFEAKIEDTLRGSLASPNDIREAHRGFAQIDPHTQNLLMQYVLLRADYNSNDSKVGGNFFHLFGIEFLTAWNARVAEIGKEFSTSGEKNITDEFGEFIDAIFLMNSKAMGLYKNGYLPVFSDSLAVTSSHRIEEDNNPAEKEGKKPGQPRLDHLRAKLGDEKYNKILDDHSLFESVEFEAEDEEAAKKEDPSFDIAPVISAPTFVNTDAEGNRLDPKGKGKGEGDGKDKEMRKIAGAFIGEISSRRSSSTLTSAKVIAKKHEGYEAVVSEKGKISEFHDVAVHPSTLTGEVTVMLARNAELKGKPLSDSTKAKIEFFAKMEYELFDEFKAKFVVGDMPGVDQPFIDLLQELGADFTVYGTGDESRIEVSSSLTSEGLIPSRSWESESAADAMVTPADDAAHLAAAERGDDETAKRMAADAAKKTNYTAVEDHEEASKRREELKDFHPLNRKKATKKVPTTVWHGSPNKGFTEFGISRSKEHEWSPSTGEAIHFATSKDYAEDYMAPVETDSDEMLFLSKKALANTATESELAKLSDMREKQGKSEESALEEPDVSLAATKVVTTDGRPRLMFRGVRSEDSRPSVEGSIGAGLYFTPNKKMAREYGDEVTAAFLNIENPLVLTTPEAGGNPLVPAFEILKEEGETFEDFQKSVINESTGSPDSKFSDRVKAAGFDGIMRNKGTTLHEVLIFESSQIDEPLPKGEVREFYLRGKFWDVDIGMKNLTNVDAPIPASGRRLSPKDIEQIRSSLFLEGSRWVNDKGYPDGVAIVTPEQKAWLQKQGFSGLVMIGTRKLNREYSSEFVVFDPSNIKLADGITRDKDGNIIPLSQRFDPTKASVSSSLTSEGRQESPEELLQLHQYSGIQRKQEEAKALDRGVDKHIRSVFDLSQSEPILYHGTEYAFREFDPKYRGQHGVNFFEDDSRKGLEANGRTEFYSEALSYAEGDRWEYREPSEFAAEERPTQGPRVMIIVGDKIRGEIVKGALTQFDAPVSTGIYEVSSSLTSMETMLTEDSPFYGQGWESAHKEMIEANRRVQAHVEWAANFQVWKETAVGLGPLKDADGKRIPLSKEERQILWDYLDLVSAHMEKPSPQGYVVVRGRIALKDLPADEQADMKKKGSNFKVVYETEASIMAKVQKIKAKILKGEFILPGDFDPKNLASKFRNAFEKQRIEENKLAANMDQAEWIPHYESYLAHNYRNETDLEKEDMARFLKDNPGPVHERTFENYYEAARVYGVLPVTLNPGEILTTRAQQVASQWLRRHMTSLQMMMRDHTGHPVMLVDFNIEGKDDRLNNLVPDDVILVAAHNLADILGEKIDITKGIRVEYDRLKSSYLRLHPDRFKGNPIESPFAKLKDGGEPDKKKKPLQGSTIRFWVQPGNSRRVAKMYLDGKWEGKIIKSIENFNTLSKYMGLAVSAFHPFALAESFVAASGLNKDNVAIRPDRTLADIFKLRDAMKRGELTYTTSKGDIRAINVIEWVGDGLKVDMKRSLDVDSQFNQMDTLLAKMIRWSEKRLGPAGPLTGAAGMKVLKLKHAWDKFLWEEMHPLLKIQTAGAILDWRLGELKDGEELTAKEMRNMRQDIAAYVNDAFGGQEWTRYIWATPKAKQMLHLMIFAPDWTLSAMQVAGFGNLAKVPFLKKYMSDHIPSQIQNDEMLRHYWPAMFGVVLAGIPNITQAVIWGASKMLGLDEEEDRPFTFMNETGKRTHVDITPLIRHFDWVPGIGYEGLPTKKRRVYLRWGKQAYEVMDYFFDPAERILTKTSSFNRTVFEQAIGSTVTGWDLPFKDQGWSGTFSVDDKIWDSRIMFAVRKFIPFSVLGFLDDQPSGFFAPSTRGVSLSKAVRDLALVLKVYSDDATMQEVGKSTRRKTNLQAMGMHIVEGATRNGYDPEEIINRAKSYVLKDLYTDYFLALNRSKYREMRRLGARILRVNGTVDGLMGSMDKRYKQAGRELSPNESKLIEASMASSQVPFEYGTLTN